VKGLAEDRIPVTVTCRVVKLSRQPYYRWLLDPTTGSEMVRAYRANALFDAHQDDPEFGHRLLADEARQAGEAMADRTAWRICRDNAWWSTFGKKRGRNGKKPGPAVHDDLCTVTDANGRVRHEFSAERPNQLWLTDITEHRTTTQGKLYLCAVKDVFSNKIVGYSIDSRMKSSLAVNALDNAVAMRGDVAGGVVHSDRGSQFRGRKFLRALARHRMVGSMGRVASCGDNAARESFFSPLQKNVLNRRSWATQEELRIAIVTWIERTYHRRRRQARLGRLTPIELEAIMNTPAALAA
jgi:putative transposase